MAIGKLSPLQERALYALAAMEPPWTLTGGAALVGFHTLHRESRDLDLFEADGLSAQTLRSSPSYSQLQVSDGSETIEIDLVADPTPQAEPPQKTTIGSSTILVDTPYQLLVNKLCALLSRSEVRDLVDVKVLLAAGGDLSRALEDCPKQDGGFSPLTFGWAVRGMPLRQLALGLGWPSAEIDELEQFRDMLVERVVGAARP